MYTPAPGKENERASSDWSVFNDSPRLTVWTRVDDAEITATGKAKGPISVSIGYEVFEDLADEIIKFYQSGVKDVRGVENMGRPKNLDGTSNFEKVHQSTLIYGRGEDGICYYGLQSTDESRPVIMFKFSGFEWHKPKRRGGSFTEEELSTIHAVGMWKYIKSAMLSGIRGQSPEERKAQAERWKARREGRPANGGGGNSRPKPAADMSSGFGDDGSFSF